MGGWGGVGYQWIGGRYLLSGCGPTRSESDLPQSSLRRFVSIQCLMWDRHLKRVEWFCEGLEMVEVEIRPKRMVEEDEEVRAEHRTLGHTLVQGFSCQ